MNSILTLTPAYGRKYPTIDDMRKAWDEGKDFRIFMGFFGGTYCSVRDVPFMRKKGITCVRLVSHNDVYNVFLD